MFWRSRSGSHIHRYLDDYDDDDEIKRKAPHYEDHMLAELTKEEIINALDVLEKIEENQQHSKELSDKEVVIKFNKTKSKSQACPQPVQSQSPISPKFHWDYNLICYPSTHPKT